jgi:hypothetical protein
MWAHAGAWVHVWGLIARQAVVGLVLAFRVARRAVHLVLEIALALALVLAATRAGWLRF